MDTRAVLPLLLAALCAVPSKAPAQELRPAQQPRQWTLSARPLLQIGVVEGEPSYQFHNVVSAVRLDDGRIAVLNAGSHELRIYDAGGRIAAVTGRRGKGPGEFIQPLRLYRGGPDSLLVYDGRNARFSVHSLDGAFVRSEPAPYGGARFMYDEWLYNRSWIDGPPLGRGRGPVRAAVDRLPAPAGDVGYRYVKVSPQGHLWVRGPSPPGAAAHWIVYDLDAGPIGRVVTPARFEVQDIGRDYLLGTGRDDLDVEYVQLFGLTGAEHAPARALAGADTARAAPPRTVPEKVLAGMRGIMRQLAGRQEVYYSKSYSYATDVRLLDGWETPRDLVVRIVNASDRGWTGVMIDVTTGATCGMSYGAFIPIGWPPGTVTCE